MNSIYKRSTFFVRPLIRRALFSTSIAFRNEKKDFNDIINPEGHEPSIPPYIEREGENATLKKSRLTYQSRKRGMLENGLLLSTFAKKYLDSFDDNQLKLYDRLINLPSNDWDIFYWATNVKPTPAEFDNEIMDLLKKHIKNDNREDLNSINNQEMESNIEKEEIPKENEVESQTENEKEDVKITQTIVNKFTEINTNDTNVANKVERPLGLNEVGLAHELRMRSDRRRNIVFRSFDTDKNYSPDELLELFMSTFNLDRTDFIITFQRDNKLALTMNSFDTKLKVLRNKELLREKFISIDDDHTRREVHIQKWLRSLSNEAKANGRQLKVGYQKVFINNECWKFNERTGELEMMPFKSQKSYS
ncbi:uncharacterized protein LOC122505246 [Leptopilina heterotoma]|uniref:uncharacterized protein LOC122505246 n=1 Tax=Leptopilina heterotoma TaxID=63436 RepID=UPI001CA7F6ED|nr:uncharacterized protein LOC122505246 [Leptopilina heterotoma]